MIDKNCVHVLYQSLVGFTWQYYDGGIESQSIKTHM